MRARNILPGTWFTQGWNIGMTPADAAFTIGEVESEADRQGIISEFARSNTTRDRIMQMPRAVITDMGPFRNGAVPAPEKAKWFVDNGFACITEVYARTDSGQPTGKTPASMADHAYQVGFQRVQSCFGIFGGATVETYSEWAKQESGWSHYVLENVLR